MKETNLKETIEACDRFNFNRQITAETCWNEGYRLGRKRWYWGPIWFVSFHGWVNTQLSRFKKQNENPT